jgi:peptidoglycan/LPS O-acetylase OafA/YrhL
VRSVSSPINFFLTSTFGYFDGSSELKPLLHLWSLSDEEQFYIIWPIALGPGSLVSHHDRGHHDPVVRAEHLAGPYEHVGCLLHISIASLGTRHWCAAVAVGIPWSDALSVPVGRAAAWPRTGLLIAMFPECAWGGNEPIAD